MTTLKAETLRALAEHVANVTVPIDSPTYTAEKWFIARDAALYALALLGADKDERVAALEAENARLREALERIADGVIYTSSSQAKIIARRALGKDQAS